MRERTFVLVAPLAIACGPRSGGEDAGPEEIFCDGGENRSEDIGSCIVERFACETSDGVHDYSYECTTPAVGPTECTCFVDLVAQETFTRDRFCELSDPVRDTELRANCASWPF